ncbi:MAG: hypothetical protein Q8934_03490 [Bacillota bacterium]|nr:hypothetical protein [Bacillota bacterium]
MLHEYEMLVTIKNRQMEIERKSRSAWRFFAEEILKEQGINTKKPSTEIKINNYCQSCA